MRSPERNLYNPESATAHNTLGGIQRSLSVADAGVYLYRRREQLDQYQSAFAAADRGPGSTDFGSDPGLAYDSGGTLFYSYIVVFVSTSGFNGVQGSELAVARSNNGGRTYPQVTYFAFTSGSGTNFNDKPLMTVDTSTGSPFRDRIYVAWDRATPGNKKQILLGRSSDHGSSFQISQVNTTLGASGPFAAVPFVGPNGEVYVAWNDFIQNVIAFNRSFDGGATWD